jgi:Fe-S-cluster containining protein
MSPPETCGGYCCERFHFRHGQSLEEIKEDAKRFPEGHERHFIADMLIFIEKDPKDLDGDGTIPVNWFTCKHFDTTTRLCKVYEQRPSICRDFNSWWNPCGMSKCKLPKPSPPDYESSVKEVIKRLEP